MIPEVKNCSVVECYYNEGEYCHANAIMVGSGHPSCDTFVAWAERHAAPAPIGHVGACHEFDCKFNEELSCHAGSINVAGHEGHADCVTYEALPDVEKDIDMEFLEQTREVEPSGSTAFRISPSE